MARLIADVNFSQRVIEVLCELGHDVLSVVESPPTGLDSLNETLLTAAINDQRVILTVNRMSLYRTLQKTTEHMGAVVATFNNDDALLVQQIHEALQANPDMRGKLIRVHRPNP